MLLPILLTAAIYAQVCRFGFSNYDDSLNVYANPLIKRFDWPSFLALWQRPYQGLYIPMTYTVWGLIAKLSSFLSGGQQSGLDPGLFHTVNLVLHLGSVALVFDILRRLLRDELAAMAGASLFGLHPLQVEAVAWVTGLKDLLGGFLALLAVRQYLLWLTDKEEAAKGRWSDYCLAAFFFLAALLAKPSAVVTPLLLGSLALFIFRLPWARVVVELGPWLIVALAVGLVTGISQDVELIGLRPVLWQRLLVAGDAYFFYFRLLFMPFDNAIDYGRAPIAALSDKWILVSAISPCLLGGIFFWRVREPVPRVAAVFFLFALLPVSGLVSFYFQRISTVADRYMYLAMLGPALGLAWVFTGRNNRLLRGSMAIYLIVCGVQSFQQIRTWENFETFYEHNLKVNPDSWFVHNNFGAAYAELGQLKNAETHYRMAIQSNPMYALAYNNLGIIKMKQGCYDEAAMYFRKATSIAGRYFMAYFHLGNALAASGDTDGAIAAYRQVTAINPDFPDVYIQLGTSYKKSGRMREAITAYRRGIDLDQGAIEPRLLLARLFLDEGQIAESAGIYRKILEIDQNCAAACNGLGLAAMQANDFPAAVASFRRAIELDHNYAGAYLDLAKAYEKSGLHELAARAAAQGRVLGSTVPVNSSDFSAGSP